MKTLILYYSETGNTKDIAYKIKEGMDSGSDVDIESIVDYSGKLNKYDLVVAGSACHHATLAVRMLKFLASMPEKPDFKFAGFYTHSTVKKDGTTRNDQLFDDWAGKCKPAFEKICKEKNIELVDIFHCQSKASKPIEMFIRLKIIKNRTEWIPYRKDMRQRPNEADFTDAFNFGKALLYLA